MAALAAMIALGYIWILSRLENPPLHKQVLAVLLALMCGAYFIPLEDLSNSYYAITIDTAIVCWIAVEIYLTRKEIAQHARRQKEEGSD